MDYNEHVPFINACFQFIDYCPPREVARPGFKGNYTGYWVTTASIKDIEKPEKQRSAAGFEDERKKVNVLMLKMLEILCGYLVKGFSDEDFSVLLPRYIDDNYKTVRANHFPLIKALLDQGYSASHLSPYLFDIVSVARETHHNDQRVGRLYELWRLGNGDVMNRPHPAPRPLNQKNLTSVQEQETLLQQLNETQQALQQSEAKYQALLQQSYQAWNPLGFEQAASQQIVWEPASGSNQQDYAQQLCGYQPVDNQIAHNLNDETYPHPGYDEQYTPHNAEIIPHSQHQ